MHGSPVSVGSTGAIRDSTAVHMREKHTTVVVAPEAPWACDTPWAYAQLGRRVLVVPLLPMVDKLSMYHVPTCKAGKHQEAQTGTDKHKSAQILVGLLQRQR